MTHKVAIIGIGVPDVLLEVPFSSKKLSRYLADKFAAKQVSITDIRALSGGAIQENWSLNLQIDGGKYDGLQKWVLRKDAPSYVSASNSRVMEFAVLSHAFANGVSTPMPICLCEDEHVIGSAFFIMEAVAGQAQAHKLVRSPAFAHGSPALGRQLGTEMARLHKSLPTAELAQRLGQPKPNPQAHILSQMRSYLDLLGAFEPVLEFALNWLEDRMDIWQTGTEPVLCHRDFRAGNFLIEAEKMTALLDWEFAGFSDSHEDIGWLCARCWRFGNDHLSVGGLAPFAPFREAYEMASGQTINLPALGCWQVMAEIRWAVIALQQARRNDSGQEPALQLALSGQMVAEMEYHMLSLINEIEEDRWQDFRA